MQPSGNHEEHRTWSTSTPQQSSYRISRPNSAPTESRAPPTPEFQCHHTDCLRRFIRKTSLTNHLKAHQNIRSRSIYRTKRARQRAAAALQAAAAAVSARPELPARTERQPEQEPTYAAPTPEPPNEEREYSHTGQADITASDNIDTGIPATGVTATGVIATGVTATASAGSETSPGMTFESSTKMEPGVTDGNEIAELGPGAILTDYAGDVRRDQQTRESAILQELATSLASPTSFSTTPVEQSDAILLGKALELAPSWHLPSKEEPEAPFPTHQTLPSDVGGSIGDTKTSDFFTESHSIPTFSTVPQPNCEFMPHEPGLFSEDIEALHNYEFLGDFVYK